MARTSFLAARRLGVIGSILVVLASCAPSRRVQQESQLAHYNVSVGRAVQKEWEARCRSHRDSIQPGSLSARFEVAPDGKVRSLDFPESSGSAPLQKRLVSQSISSAAIPPFPDLLKKQLNDEPLEIIYRFTY